MTRVSFQARVFVGATILVGLAIAAVAVLRDPPAVGGTLALLLAGVVLAELLQVSYDDGSPESVNKTFSFSSGVHVAAVLILGPAAAVLVAGFGVLAVDRFRGSPWSKVGFNAASFALATFAGGLAFTAVGGRPGELSLPGDFGPLAAMALAYGAVNTVLVAAVVALVLRSPIGTLLRPNLSDVASTAAEASVGVLLALCALAEPWAVAAVVPLAVAAFQARARHAALRRETAQALETFANIIDERDAATYRHSARVAEHAAGLAAALGVSAVEVAKLETAARLHDLGKIAVDAAVIRKPGRLNPEEWAAMRRHARLSARLLRRFQFAVAQSRAVEYHHERYDGYGYYGIERADIPLASHFLAVADTYDAMRSDRSYREGLSEEAALAEIEANAGSQFHPAVARAFVAYRRGLDPASALTPAEHEQLRALSVRAAAHRRMSVARLAKRGHVIAPGAAAAALAALGLGQPIGAGVLTAIALASIGWDRRTARRRRRLKGTLETVLAGSLTPTQAFAAVTRAVSGEAKLSWAGLVSWREQELGGTLALTWGSGPALAESALTSWLVREADTSREPLLGAGADFGRRGDLVAVPVSGDDRLTAFLVLAFEGTAPFYVVDALRASASSLSPLGLPVASSEPRALVAVS
jgi:putative nucleotidyltransferase with HDIG domain